MEAKSSWRPRYNVAPKSGGVVLRKNHREKGGYELDVLKWGLVRVDLGPHQIARRRETIRGYEGERENEDSVV